MHPILTQSLPIRLLRALLRPKSRKPSEAFRESTIRFAASVALVYFSILMVLEAGREVTLISVVWYGLIYALIGGIFLALHHERVQWAARITISSAFLIVIDPSRAYWSPGTVVLNVIFTFLFEMILDRRRDVILAVALNLAIYTWIVLSDLSISPLNPDDYFSQPSTAIVATFIAHFIVVGIAYFIRRDQARRDRTELLVEQQNVDMLQQFLGRTSHDLRTVLTKTRLQLLQIKRVTPADNQEQVWSLEQSVEQLEKMLLSMLEMSQLDSTSAFELKLVNVQKLLAALIDQSIPPLTRKSLTLDYTPSSIALFTEADETYLMRAINNILENAILYTPEQGTITIQTYLDSRYVVIAIHDSGPGIAPETIAHIFDRFYRGEAARTQTTGSGLGLAISKKIVELHGGKIAVESVPGTGSTFTIMLPAHQPPRRAAS